MTLRTFARAVAQCTPMPPVHARPQVAGDRYTRGVIDFAKFMLAAVFLLAIGTCGACLYVCGTAADDVSKKP